MSLNLRAYKAENNVVLLWNKVTDVSEYTLVLYKFNGATYVEVSSTKINGEEEGYLIKKLKVAKYKMVLIAYKYGYNYLYGGFNYDNATKLDRGEVIVSIGFPVSTTSSASSSSNNSTITKPVVPTKAYKRDGKKIIFGEYPQGKGNKVQPIEWDILAEEFGQVLIISHNVIDFHEFSERDQNNYGKSLVRTWLNNDFINKAFTKGEQSIIQATLVDNSAYSTCEKDNENICGDTYDKIFLLSVREVEKYFSTQSLRVAKVDDEYGFLKATSWYTRSPFNFTTKYAISVGHSGDYEYYTSTYSHNGIRPCCWIKL